MHSVLVAILLALQESASGNAAPVLGVSLFIIVIGVIMVCLLILGVLSLGQRDSGTKRRT